MLNAMLNAMLNDDQRRLLLRTARAAVASALRDEPAEIPVVEDEALRARRGAFVTLHARGELRGCIGVIEGLRPLIETVASCAVSAATGDPRFAPLTINELPGVRFEVSVLSEPRPIGGAGEIEIGRDGVIVTGGARKALLLPQVAPEQGWDAGQLLTAACRKAGLAPAAWQGGAVRLERFTAEVFGEEP